MKIFISYKHVDQAAADQVALRLQQEGVEIFLDKLNENQNGLEISEYLKGHLRTCTDLIVVIPSETKQSWWVPWEIGVASGQDSPMATFVSENTSIPDYLKKWPYLRSLSDVSTYVREKRITDRYIVEKSASFRTASSRTGEFYRRVRAAFGQ